MERIDRPIRRVMTEEKVVALTFDDGPDANCLHLLRLFKEQQVRATFFLIGNRVEKEPDIVRALHAAGMEIGNHSYTHANMKDLSPEQVREETLQTQAALQAVTHTAPRLYRAPYLQYNESLWEVLTELQMPAVNASVDSTDWVPEITAEMIFERMTTNIQSGDILLMHSWSGKTLEVMPRILESLREQGFQFVTVSEMRTVGEDGFIGR
ncbi:MAG: polysaccharide deacetylase family protein [Verrucomicrobia bacterium]|nr:polysaccharide deacetylase family protein [Verrucomicrobiota bacterium]MCH8525792.1 polysaccharide deacetylase family protein [Kiritimatiellia bacterium]